MLARLGSALTAAMDPAAPAVDREARFGEAASALAVPLREDPRRLHLTCVPNSTTDRWLLLETPEPMDLPRRSCSHWRCRSSDPG